jgi:hypothetical protein
LHGPFRRQWEATDWKHVGKALQRVVNENGEVSVLTEPAQRLQATGARWPYPHRADGTEWPDAGPGAYPGASPGDEPPGHINDMAAPEPHVDVEPRGGDDGKMPRRRKPNPPASAFPNQGTEHDEMWPPPQTTLTPAASPVGVPKRAKVSKASVNYRSGTNAEHCGNCVMFLPSEPRADDGRCTLVEGPIDADDTCDEWEAAPAEKSTTDSGHPVVGSVPTETPKPYKPHSVPPEAFDPAETVEEWSPEAGSNIAHDLPHAGKGAGGPSDYRDANPVDPEHILSIMRANFPEKALGWVKRAAWIGPVLVPWERVDHDDDEKWAAAHQPAKVRQFTRDIKAGRQTNPSILFQPPGDGKTIVADGHHRAVARHEMGQDILAYVGAIRAADREAAEQTHSSQFHGGSDPANKSGDAETLREYWTHEAHGGPTDFAYADEIAWGTPGDFMRAVRLLKEHAHMTDEQAKGYANLMHHRALGYWPAQHAQMEGKNE